MILLMGGVHSSFEAIGYVQEHDGGWIDEVKEQRVGLLRKIENRLISN